ncbi:MAG: porin family protein [Muribaculaceae bacterium]|nr:porin family protein [Muribaculaceae bacterium]
MKKTKIIALTLLVALFTGFSAQAKSGFSFGPKLGVNINKLSISMDGLNSDNRCGFTGGLTAEFIAPVFGVGADISIMYAYMISEVGGQTIKGNFFEIPLHIKYKLSLPAIESIISPYIFTGPSVAFKINSGNNFGETKATQWGWDLGLGVELIKHLQIGAGYTFGINNIMPFVPMETGAISDDIKVKNNYWTVTAAWMF